MSPHDYYGEPVLKPPTWRPYVGTYIFLGGLAGGSSLLAAGAELTGNARLARATRLTALGAIALGSGALVADLGRPDRLHHMLRVFKPSSPMNVGSWILTAYAPATGVAVACDFTRRFPTVGRLATLSAATLAPAVSTYTAVLVTDTAIPAWHDVRRRLPMLFAAGAAASSGGAACIFVPDEPPARAMAVAGACAEVALAAFLHQRLEPEVARAYTSGRPARLRRAALAAALAGTGLLLFDRAHGARTRVAGAVLGVSALLERFSIMAAGHVSARDPQATVAPQRRRLTQVGAETAMGTGDEAQPGAHSLRSR